MCVFVFFLESNFPSCLPLWCFFVSVVWLGIIIKECVKSGKAVLEPFYNNKDLAHKIKKRLTAVKKGFAFHLICIV